MTSVADAFGWPFQDPGWFGKIVLQGLIGIIPIVGWIALYGWFAMTIDNYRAGRHELPPAGFHLARGVALFVVVLVYEIVVNIPGSVLQGTGSSGHNSGAAGLGSLVSFVLGLLLAFLLPAIYLHTYRSGFAGGFDLNGIWTMATSNVSTSVVAGLLTIVAGIIGLVGIVVCFVGLLFTIPYAIAITAGVVTWYEQAMARPAPSPGQPA